VARGQSLEFLFQGHDHVARACRGVRRSRAASGGPRLALLSPDLVGAGAEGEAIRDLVEPAAQPLVAHQGRGLARQDEEGGLEGVLGAVNVVQHAAADAEDQRPVTAHQHLDGGFVAVGHEPLQQLTVRHCRRRHAADQVAEVLQQGVGMGLGHARVLGAFTAITTLLETGRAASK